MTIGTQTVLSRFVADKILSKDVLSRACANLLMETLLGISFNDAGG